MWDFFLAVGAGAVAISYVCIRYMDAGRELQRVEKTINKIIQLQNKVKIRYVNNCQLMEYLYLKYNTDSAAKLEKQWKMYQDEKEERKQFAEAEAKIEYYQKQPGTAAGRLPCADAGAPDQPDSCAFGQAGNGGDPSRTDPEKTGAP